MQTSVSANRAGVRSPHDGEGTEHDTLREMVAAGPSR
jgi:hypothetical protein